MSVSKGHLVVLITIPKSADVEGFSKKLVEEKLAACVNIVPTLKSIFWWQGRVDEEEEYLLVVKTRSDKFKELVDAVKKRHPYTVPEIVALPIVAGNREYLEWLDSVVGQ